MTQGKTEMPAPVVQEATGKDRAIYDSIAANYHRELSKVELERLRRVTIRKPTVWERRAYLAGKSDAEAEAARGDAEPS